MSETNGPTDQPAPANAPDDNEPASNVHDFGADPIPEHLTDAALDGHQIKKLAEERIAELAAEAEGHKEQSLRLAAELENTRKRAERERQDASKYAISSFARDLLSVADNFSRALELAPEDPADMDKDGLASLVNGVRMTERELMTIFERNGISRIEPKGEKFDPNVHQAIAQVPGNGQAKDFVVDVAAPGFLIGERVIRPAMVTVSTGANAAPGSENSGGIDTRV